MSQIFKVLCSALFTCLMFKVVGVANASEPEQGLVRFERIEEISVAHFWELAVPSFIGSEGNAVIGYWPFDYDSVSKIDEWYLIGIIGAGWFGLGETPVVAKVYAKRDVYLLAEESEKETKKLVDSAVAIFGVSPRVCRDEPQESCPSRVVFSVDKDGVVTGAGVELGVVED